MNSLQNIYEVIDTRMTAWMARHGIILLRISLGMVFFWFGFLKFFPGLSPAQGIADRTIALLTFGLISADVSITILACWECLIGLGLIFGVCLRTTLFLLWLQMLGTISPLLLLTEEVFTVIPYAPSFEGQYIIKNFVLICAGIVIGATVRGGKITSE